jgi:hypothetical protein
VSDSAKNSVKEKLCFAKKVKQWNISWRKKFEENVKLNLSGKWIETIKCCVDIATGFNRFCDNKESSSPLKCFFSKKWKGDKNDDKA